MNSSFFIGYKINKQNIEVEIIFDEIINGDFEYAFYLISDSNKIESKWYSENKNAIFNFDFLKLNNAKVIGFVKNSRTGEIFSKSTKLEKKYELKIDAEVYDEIPFSIDLNNKDRNFRISFNEELIDGVVAGLNHIHKKTVLIFFTAAVNDRKNKTAPFFSGLKIGEKLELTTISFADPSVSFSENVSLGWYLGTNKNRELPELIASWLDDFAKKTNCEFIFCGGSGGGFASILISSFVNTKSTVIAWNPQTDVSEYHGEVVWNYLENIFNVSPEDGELKKVLSNLNLKFDIKKHKGSCSHKTYIFQSISDLHHIKFHFIPYLNHAGYDYLPEKITYGFPNDSQVIFGCGNWGKGHVTLPINFLFNLIKKIQDNLNPKELVENFLKSNEVIENYYFLKENFSINSNIDFDAYRKGYKTEWNADHIDFKNKLYQNVPFGLHHQYINDFKQFFEPSNFYRNVVTICHVMEMDPDRREIYIKIIDGLVNSAVDHSFLQNGARFISYSYKLKRKRYELEPGWVSAIGNSFVIRGLARIFEITKSKEILNLQKSYAEAFFVINSDFISLKRRWFSWIDCDGYLWFDEYPGDDNVPSLVLNGHIHSLHGLFYHIKSIDNEFEKERFFNLYLAGITTVKANSLKFRRKNKINGYSLRELFKDDYLPDRTLRQQNELFKITGDIVFKKNLEIFEKDFKCVECIK